MQNKLKYKVFFLFYCVVCVSTTVLSADNTDFDRGLIWQVNGKGIKTAYVFGTIHSENEAVLKLPSIVQRVFDQSPQFVMEVVFDQKAMMKHLTTTMLTPGTTLRDILDISLYRQVVAAMTKRGLPEVAVNLLKPWVIMSSLMLPERKTGLFLDLKLYQDAKKQGKVILGLESIEEQLDIFNTLTLEEQISLLKQTLAEKDKIPKILEQLHALYLEGKTGELLRLSNDLMEVSKSDLSKKLNDRLLNHRNIIMAERIQKIIKQNQTFIAIGAAHLPGKVGVLNLLAKQGYQIKRLGN